ncbi:MAG: hypothetical protein CL910_08255 [Deltaproteobacteria bacterium]|jgi:hypothetical protein|nr:hypothetical protein [Deltaproteobacteria bacterium]
MTWIKTLLGCALALVAVLCLAGYALIESGEVIVLQTLDESDDPHRTRLWVLDYDGDPWIGKADSANAGWVARLHAEPRVDLLREGQNECRRAVFMGEGDLSSEVRDEMKRLFEEKYRTPMVGAKILGAVFGLVLGGDDEAPAPELIRLVPCDTPPLPQEELAE